MKRMLLLAAMLLSASMIGAQDDESAGKIAPETVTELGLLTTLDGHFMPVNDIAFTPDGSMLASAGDDLSLRLWDVPAGEQISETYAHNSYVRGVAINAAGDLLMSTSWDQSVRRFDLSADGDLSERPSLEGFRHITEHIALSDDGTWVGFTAGDGSVHLINVTQFDERALYALDALAFNGIAFAPDVLPDRSMAAVATGFPDDALLLLTTQNDDALTIDHDHAGSVTGLAFAPNDAVPQTLATVGDDGALRLWAITPTIDGDALAVDSELLDVFETDDAPWFTDVAFHPSGDLLAATTLDGQILLWDVRDPSEVALLNTLDAPSGTLLTVAFDPTGVGLAAAGDAGAIYVWGRQ